MAFIGVKSDAISRLGNLELISIYFAHFRAKLRCLWIWVFLQYPQISVSVGSWYKNISVVSLGSTGLRKHTENRTCQVSQIETETIGGTVTNAEVTTSNKIKLTTRKQDILQKPALDSFIWPKP